MQMRKLKENNIQATEVSGQLLKKKIKKLDLLDPNFSEGTLTQDSTYVQTLLTKKKKKKDEEKWPELGPWLMATKLMLPAASLQLN